MNHRYNLSTTYEPPIPITKNISCSQLLFCYDIERLRQELLISWDIYTFLTLFRPNLSRNRPFIVLNEAISLYICRYFLCHRASWWFIYFSQPPRIRALLDPKYPIIQELFKVHKVVEK